MVNAMKRCELCTHDLKYHNKKGNCSVCMAKVVEEWSPCCDLVTFKLPAQFNELLEHVAVDFRVSPEEMMLILLEVDYYCDTFLGLPATKTDVMIGEVAKTGDITSVRGMLRTVTEEEKSRITEAFGLLLEKDGFFRKIVKKHKIPTPNYIAVFHHLLITKARYIPGIAEALERRLKSLDFE